MGYHNFITQKEDTTRMGDVAAARKLFKLALQLKGYCTVCCSISNQIHISWNVGYINNVLHKAAIANQSRISRTPYPPSGGAHAVTGAPKFNPSPLSRPEKTSIPKLKYEALEISEVRGPFERKVPMHYNYFGPF